MICFVYGVSYASFSWVNNHILILDLYVHFQGDCVLKIALMCSYLLIAGSVENFFFFFFN